VSTRTADATWPTVTSPVPREVWASVVKSDPGALVTQSLPWRDALFASGRFRDVSRLYEFPSGQRIVLPLAQRRARPGRLAPLSSWPQPWAVGGPISSGGQVEMADAKAVLADIIGQGTIATELKLRHGGDPNWLKAASAFRVQPSNCWMLDLSKGADDVWSRKFRKGVRRAVRKAERSGLDIEVDRSGKLLDTFYQLYQKSIVRWAAMQHAPLWLTRARLASTTNPARLRHVALTFGRDCSIWIARHDGEAVAALIVLSAGRYAKAWLAAMDKTLAAPLGGVNQLLDWLAVQDAVHHGYLRYDLGYATPGTSLGGYKERLGADLVFHTELRSERLPLQTAQRLPREVVKRVIGFRDNL
jgi:Acetyltransferase (GNAT) domain